MWHTVDIIEAVKPKYIIWENVKNILSQKHIHNFNNYLDTLNNLGYSSFYKVLNAKDYGIPQNRERVFVISISNELATKITDKNNKNLCEYVSFSFPPSQELKLRLKDILEKDVDEKYYLSEKITQGFIKHNEIHEQKGTGFIWKPKEENDIASTLRANGALCPTDNTIKVIGNLDIKGQDCIKRVYSDKGLSPTLTNMQGGNRQPKILELPCIVASRGRNPNNPSDRTTGSPTEQRLEVNSRGIANTITSVQKDNYVLTKYKQFINRNGYVPKMYNPYNNREINDSAPTQTNQSGSTTSNATVLIKESSELNKLVTNTQFRIRKLTPCETWRLMGFDDTDIEKCMEVGISNSQLYKQARKLDLCTSIRGNF